MIDKIINSMGKLGFTKYEARAYIALLQHNPATGYELSRASGIPRSAIYDIMKKLENAGLINALTSKPKEYIPLEPKKLVEMLRDKFDSDITDVEKGLEGIDATVEGDHLWTINDYGEVLRKARQMVDSAEEDIYLSIWNREALQIKENIDAACDRGVKVEAFSFTELPFGNCDVYAYGIAEPKLEKIWKHTLILVRDKDEVLMGEANPNERKKVAWTRNSAMVNIAITNIILDMTLYGQRLGVDVSRAVVEMHNGELGYLGNLLKEAGIPNP